MTQIRDLWIPFDSVWIIRTIEHPVSLDPLLKEEPHRVQDLIGKLRRIDKALLLENPDNGEKSFYFYDPRNAGWGVAYSLEVFGQEADFMFNFMPDNSLGALHIHFHEARAPL